ncbi:MAG: glycosyltransferase family 2 protein [Acidimicrobiales bacterium]|nr:glycosyltransferase family 2 protein [Acidimicrobiales bacterium]
MSVVIIFFNEAEHLRDAIESVLAQTYRDWELVLVDDGSDDQSVEVARDYAERHPENVTLVQHPGGANRGMSASRNLGVAQSRGDWITFLDGDDVWEADKLEGQFELLAQHLDVDVLVSPALWWYDSDDGPVDFVQALHAAPDSIVPGSDLVRAFLQDEWASLCDVLMKRDCFNDAEGYESDFRDMFEDQVFHTKLLLGRHVLVTRRWWYRYRQHPEATTALAHAGSRHRRARAKFLFWAMRYTLMQAEVPWRLRSTLVLESARLGAGPRAVLRRILATPRRAGDG